MMLLGVVDTFFISLLGTTELAAAGFVMPVYMLFMNLALGIGMGIGSLTSRLIGEKKTKDAGRFITDSHILAFFIAVFAAVFTYLFLQELFSLLGANEKVMPHIEAYMNVILLGIPIQVLMMIGNNTFRAIGNIRASATISISMSLLNMILDPFFIFGLWFFPELGMQGAAVATVIAMSITWVATLYILGFKEKLLLTGIPVFETMLLNWRKLLTIAIPAIGANMMTPVGAAVMTAMIARFGAEAVAGFAVGARIEAMSLLVAFALSSTLPMFIGQNIGAGRGDRAYQGLMLCLKFIIAFQFVVYVVLLLGSQFITGSFSSNIRVIEVIDSYLYIMPLTYSAHAAVILIMVSLNVLKRPRTALLITVIRLAFLYLPLAYLGSLFLGTTGLFLGAACGNVLAGLMAFRIIKQVCTEQGLDCVQTNETAPQRV